MFEAFVRVSKVKYGFTAIEDVRDGGVASETGAGNPKLPRFKDSQESFWMAETLKYFYLIFSPRDRLNLDEF
jgi:mannosyl-oligosaccharide alpha-1,2-mannosidase